MTAPLWFKAPFKILRLFVREKLRDRVYTVSANQLSLHVPRQSLPLHLGGKQEIDHSTWLSHCYDQQQRIQMTNREEGPGAAESDDNLLTALKNSLDILTNNLSESNNANNSAPDTNGSVSEEVVLNSSDPIISLVSSLGDLGEAEPNNNNNHGTEVETGTTNTTGVVAVDQGEDAVTAVEKLNLKNNNNNLSNIESSWTENPPSSASSGFSDDDSLATADVGDYKTIEQVVEMVRERGRKGLMSEYAEIKMRPPVGTFTNARLLPNMHKNRYTDVLCYDHSRVILEGAPTEAADIKGLDSVDSSVAGAGTLLASTDYINANFVDGYKQKNAYISTQGPLPKTSADFWRMVWEQQCLVIVMTTRVNERGRIKCGQYWETQEDSAIEFGHFRIYTKEVQAIDDYTVASLELTNLKVSGQRIVG